MKVKSLSLIHLLATPRTAAYQAPLSMGFSRQEYWSGLPVPSPAARLSKCLIQEWIFLVVQMVRNLPGMQETGLIPGLGRSPGEGNGNPLQYSCLENPMDRGAWWITVHGVAKSQTGLSNFTFFHFPLGWTDLISLLFKGHSRVFITTIQKH